MRPFRFAVISDPHVALPSTIRDIPNRFHLVEVSIPALEQILHQLETQELDFLLLPGDLTQHGERENHHWLAKRLKQLPFPSYVVPGNHDIIARDGCDRTLSEQEFPEVYGAFGYGQPTPYYTQELMPGVSLIGLNSIAFDDAGQQLPVGYVDPQQLTWLSEQLDRLQGQLVFAMIHHNVLEHLPGQANHPLGQRYMLQNRDALLAVLNAKGVRLIFTGHLHVQDIVQEGPLREITTGSLVSYPHPYRIVSVTPQTANDIQVQVESFRVSAVENWPDLQTTSLRWMRDRSLPFMVRLLTCPPFGLSPEEAEKYAPSLKDFWAHIAAGDVNFDYPQLPAKVNQHLQLFGAIDPQGNHRPVDNNATFSLGH